MHQAQAFDRRGGFRRHAVPRGRCGRLALVPNRAGRGRHDGRRRSGGPRRRRVARADDRRSPDPLAGATGRRAVPRPPRPRLRAGGHPHGRPLLLPQGRGGAAALARAPAGRQRRGARRDGRRRAGPPRLRRWRPVGPSRPAGQPGCRAHPRRHRRRAARARPLPTGVRDVSHGWCRCGPTLPPMRVCPTRASWWATCRGALATMRQAADAAGTPDDAAWVSYQIGELSFRSGRLSAAVSAYRRAAALSPTFVPAEAGLAKIAWARGHVDRAIRGYRRVVARYPLPEHVIALGDLYTIEGRTAQADDAYALARAEAALFRSNGVNVDVELALFEADHGEPVAALADARAGLAITSQHPCRGRARLGPVSQRAGAAGGPPGAAGASARHAGRALVLPRRHDRPAARRPRRGSADADARAGHQPALLDPVRNPGAADDRPAAPVSAPPTSCGP